ncbi:MAG: hypothetical protein ACOCZJ_02520 [Thermoplasmatota archaeon]
MAETESQLISKKYLSIFYAFLASLGVAFYLSWNILYGKWFDVGVYSVTVVLVGFGIIGFLLYTLTDEEE